MKNICAPLYGFFAGITPSKGLLKSRGVEKEKWKIDQLFRLNTFKYNHELYHMTDTLCTLTQINQINLLNTSISTIYWSARYKNNKSRDTLTYLKFFSILIVLFSAINSSARFRSYRTRFDLDSAWSFFEPKASNGNIQYQRHALLVIGYRRVTRMLLPDRTDFLVKNTWSAAWGHHGYGWVVFAELTRNVMGFGAEVHWIEQFTIWGGTSSLNINIIFLRIKAVWWNLKKRESSFIWIRTYTGFNIFTLL